MHSSLNNWRAWLGIVLLAAASPVLAQDQKPQAESLWKEVSRDSIVATPTRSKVHLIKAYRTVEMNDFAMNANLREAGFRTALRASSSQPMTLPMPDGSDALVTVEESPFLSAELQALYPELRTYIAHGIDDPSLTAYLDHTPLGFHAQIFTDRGLVYIDPLDAAQNLYLSYWKEDAGTEPFSCLTPETEQLVRLPVGAVRQKGIALTNPSGATGRSYRLAVTATNEYSTFFGNAACPAPVQDACATTAAQAAITTTMNRVRGIYQNEANITLNLVRFNIYAPGVADPFPNGATIDQALLNQNQTALDANGQGNTYDIGHILSQGGPGGLAPGDTCTAQKAQGGTSLANPQGDGFDVDFVAHEVGHQMGGNHTFNAASGGAGNSCTNATRTAGSAYEPGSGSTIMAYAGVCSAAENVQSNSNAYFHVHSLDQITDFRDTGSGSSCGTALGGTTPPAVNAGPDFTIPRGTPFTLTATGNGTTYAWEQFNLGPAASTPNSNDTQAPLFRSRLPGASLSRTFPRFSTVLGATTDPFEVLPTVDRGMTFRVTARNNQGASRWDDTQITVSGAPFNVAFPANGSNLECGLSQNITWNVGGGSVSPNVRMSFSSDNGANFADVLGSTPNDGGENVSLPKTLTNQGRVMLSSIGNIFFNVSGPFTIRDTQSPAVTAPGPVIGECSQKSPQGAVLNIGSASATDACDASISITSNKPAVFPLGLTQVTWSGTDDALNVGTAVQNVTVVDTTPPTITAPPNIVAECTSPLGTPVALGMPVTNDVCWANLTVFNNGPGLFPLGQTTVTWTVVDGSTNSSTAPQTVKIQDTTPPQLSFTLSQTTLWPPDHKLALIRASITVSDICDATPTVRLVSITSNEPDNGLGDGDTQGDIQGAVFGADDREFYLRSERSGTGAGRVYTVTYEARDASGNTTVRQAVVTVAHNQ